MNEMTFMLALLLEKNIITKEEAVKLHKVVVNQTISNNLDEMRRKVLSALKPDESAIKLDNVSAKDLL